VYDARALAELRGNRYKSQRAACNRFVRAHRFRYEPYEERYREPCLDLYRKWAMQKEARGADSVAKMMLEDSAGAHHAVLTTGRQLGLIGRVVWMDDVLAAYTFGYFRTSCVFCVLVEIADRSIAGLASYLFREFCREAYEQGATVINTLDDSGLEALGRSKQSYHPVRMIRNYIASTSLAGWNILTDQ
ncbi:MAG: phosphatidylglycerol lysyltransferase domain-containing protein, partial [Nitrospirota bacterium]|nr:phosphatidylglycerol lysyltransferase domain-containing protein [Nitrospirota bacterium]